MSIRDVSFVSCYARLNVMCEHPFERWQYIRGWDNRVSSLSSTTNMNIRWLTDPHLRHLTQFRLAGDKFMVGPEPGLAGKGGDGRGLWRRDNGLTSQSILIPDQWPGTDTTAATAVCRQSQNSWQNAPKLELHRNTTGSIVTMSRGRSHSQM